MELCANGHEEICFETRSCPLCDAQSETEELMKDAQSEIEELMKKISEIEELMKKIDDLEDKIVEILLIISVRLRWMLSISNCNSIELEEV